MNRVSLFTAFALVSTLLPSCKIEDSADVNQDKIWAQYELFYDLNNDRTIASAVFRLNGESGDVLKLNEDATVRFNGTAMEYNSSLDAYALDLSGLIDSGTFAYQDLDQLIFENTVLPFDTIALPTELDTIFRNETNVLTWIGNELDTLESVEVYFGDWSWGATPATSISELGATQLSVTFEHISGISESQTTCYLDRVRTSTAAEATSVGGLVVGRYRSMNKTVQIAN